MIYFVENNGCVKIGYTNHPAHRFSQLQSCSPNKLKMLLLMTGGREKEKELHDLFYRFKMSGEWFKLSSQIEGFIEEYLYLDRRYEFGFIEEEFDSNQQLRRIRKQKNWTGTKLAEVVGVNKQRISRIEQDEKKGRIKIATLQRCADAMGYRLEYRLVKKSTQP